MAEPRLKVVIQDGSWSNPSTWNNNEVPVAGDYVSTNSNQVTIDQDVVFYGLTNEPVGPLKSNTSLVFNDEPEGAGVAEDSVGNYQAYLPWSSNTGHTYFPSAPYWTSYSFSESENIIINRYSFSGYSNDHYYNPAEWTFEAYDEISSSWVVLDSVQDTGYGTTYESQELANTVAYNKYRLNIQTARKVSGGTANPGPGAISLRTINLYQKGSYYGTSGGGGNATINGSYNITSTNLPLKSNNYELLYCNTNSPDVVNINSDIGNGYYANTITISGDGTYNFTGDILESPSYNSDRTLAIQVNSAATINFVGDVYGGGYSYAHGIRLSADGATLNLVGDSTGGAGHYTHGIGVYSASTVNITGNLYPYELGGSISGGGIRCNNSSANITIVGNVTSNSLNGDRYGAKVDYANTLDITGNVTAGTGMSAIFSRTINLLTIVGTIRASSNQYGFFANEFGINHTSIFSGPFVSGESGLLPFRVSVLKLIPAFNNYFEFRDTSLNTYTLVAPNAVVDSPNPEDVREGTSYALGTYTGSLAVPQPNQVTLGVATDDTVGTAVLTGDGVWNVLTSTMTTPGSIGERLKNASTVESTGDQLESFL